MIDVTWPGVVLLLGTVGLNLGTVCFTIWTMRQAAAPAGGVEGASAKAGGERTAPTGQEVGLTAGAAERWPGEEETQVEPPR